MPVTVLRSRLLTHTTLGRCGGRWALQLELVDEDELPEEDVDEDVLSFEGLLDAASDDFLPAPGSPAPPEPPSELLELAPLPAPPELLRSEPRESLR